MRTQRFGIEIEMTGITREKAAEAIAEYFGTESFYIGTYYKTYGGKGPAGQDMESHFRLQHHRTEKERRAHGAGSG